MSVFVNATTYTGGIRIFGTVGLPAELMKEILEL